MSIIFKQHRQYQIPQERIHLIESDIEGLSNLPPGIFSKVKIFELEYYIKIIINRNIIGIALDESNIKYNNIPEFITFLVIINHTYPTQPPPILAKSTFSFPNLMDGRNLTPSIFSTWKQELTLYDIAVALPVFLKRVLFATSYSFYGIFDLGAVYDLTNYNNMLVNMFPCKRDKHSPHTVRASAERNEQLTLVLSDDCLIVFELLDADCKFGEVVFWSTLYAITDIKINKMRRIVCLNFYSDERNNDKELRLEMVNVLFFREALIKRMNRLKVSIEVEKLIKGHLQEKKISEKEIKNMSIAQTENYLKYLKSKIDHNDITFYVVNMFSVLCGKVIEHYSANDSDSNSEKREQCLKEMKELFNRKDVQSINVVHFVCLKKNLKKY